MIETKTRFIRTRITVTEGERAILLIDGVLAGILRPGRHGFWSFRRKIACEGHAFKEPVFRSVYEQAIRLRPNLMAEHFTEVRTSAAEVAVLYRDGKLYSVLGPDGRLLLWTDAGPWRVEIIAVPDTLEVEDALSRRLLAASSVDRVKRFVVEQGQTGLLFIDGAFIRALEPGLHSFWNTGRTVNVKIVDTREHAMEVTGQEVLTRDKVSIRVNLVARYSVTDPVRAVSAVKDYADALYRSLQHAFRQSLATRTLDDILSRKGETDAEAAAAVRYEMLAIGIEVAGIAIKDVVLPGDMRDLLNKVVAAEKDAEAQVIRRREETNATRSLLNTARVMAENPAMLRLKELEALEQIASKVQSLTIHNGTRGLLEDIASLSAR
ncbi:MAG: slipin family protein [Aestuariivirga sp.]|uniref:slipin family protein n=1 Tax=Aestuariivirga sp. TaxID=2650926 RepID=UPI0025BCBD65|nr:slipin family protein [Aestuariivirga sp.]MCA3561067.1 slipin family protein [Aestuariivirga sp.]